VVSYGFVVTYIYVAGEPILQKIWVSKFFAVDAAANEWGQTNYRGIHGWTSDSDWASRKGRKGH
jgi:hypothetical protein